MTDNEIIEIIGWPTERSMQHYRSLAKYAEERCVEIIESERFGRTPDELALLNRIIHEIRK